MMAKIGGTENSHIRFSILISACVKKRGCPGNWKSLYLRVTQNWMWLLFCLSCSFLSPYDALSLKAANPFTCSMRTHNMPACHFYLMFLFLSLFCVSLFTHRNRCRCKEGFTLLSSVSEDKFSCLTRIYRETNGWNSFLCPCMLGNIVWDWDFVALDYLNSDSLTGFF